MHRGRVPLAPVSSEEAPPTMLLVKPSLPSSSHQPCQLLLPHRHGTPTASSQLSTPHLFNNHPAMVAGTWTLVQAHI